MRNTVLYGDAMAELAKIPDESVQCCVTSPPYWNLRDYGTDGQIGLEETPEEYVDKLVQVFREVRRALHPSGTLWLNLGDSYAKDGQTGQNQNKGARTLGSKHDGGSANSAQWVRSRPPQRVTPGTKPKDLVGIPWMAAFALRADGWWLRSDVIWHKNNPLPEPVRDRPTCCHEHIFLLTKAEYYFYDHEAIRETASQNKPWSVETSSGGAKNASVCEGGLLTSTLGQPADGYRNKRNVWTINPVPYKEAHFAVFPPAIPELCIKAGTSQKGACPHCGAPWEQETGWEPTCECPDNDPAPCLVLDPFAGSGTTLAVATSLRRDYIGVELNPKYKTLIDERLRPEVEARSQRDVFDIMGELDDD